MTNSTKYASIITPTPQNPWARLSDEGRIALVQDYLKRDSKFNAFIELVTAKSDGQVIVRFPAPLNAQERGGLLLDFEELLKASIDPALVVWLEPLGDKNSLRNLRGIKVKS
jgi:hypothetical protein